MCHRSTQQVGTIMYARVPPSIRLEVRTFALMPSRSLLGNVGDRGME